MNIANSTVVQHAFKITDVLNFGNNLCTSDTYNEVIEFFKEALNNFIQIITTGNMTCHEVLAMMGAMSSFNSDNIFVIPIVIDTVTNGECTILSTLFFTDANTIDIGLIVDNSFISLSNASKKLIITTATYVITEAFKKSNIQYGKVIIIGSQNKVLPTIH